MLGFPIIYKDMDKIIAVLFEEKKEESYIAIELGGNKPEILLLRVPLLKNKWALILYRMLKLLSSAGIIQRLKILRKQTLKIKKPL